jgi:hypothetical protein
MPQLVTNLHDFSASQLDSQNICLLPLGERCGRQDGTAEAGDGPGNIQFAAVRILPPAQKLIADDFDARRPGRLINAVDIRAVHLGPVGEKLLRVHDEPHYAHDLPPGGASRARSPAERRSFGSIGIESGVLQTGSRGERPLPGPRDRPPL